MPIDVHLDDLLHLPAASVTVDLTERDVERCFRVTVISSPVSYRPVAFDLHAGEMVQVLAAMHAALLRWVRLNGADQLDDLGQADMAAMLRDARPPDEPPNTVLLAP